MTPARLGDGTVINPKGFAEVRKGDGTVLWTSEPAIPDSEANQKLIHRWLLDDVNAMVEDSVGNADGTNNGVTSVAGDWAGGSAGNGDGIDDYIETTTWGSFGSQIGDGVAIAATVQLTTDSFQRILGSRNDAFDMRLVFGPNTDKDNSIDEGNVGFILEDSSGDDLSGDAGISNINDGQPHRLVLNIISPSSNNVEIYIDGVESTVIGDDDGPDNWNDFEEPVFLFAENNRGSVSGEFEGILDDICIFNDSLTQTEIESYDNPWD